MDARLFLKLNEAKTENLKFPQCLGAHLTGQRPVGAFAPYGRFAAGKISAQAEFTSTEHFNLTGRSRLWRLELQKERGG